ncbi:PepSY domain-containing protein [Streptomyces sp. NBC_00859]|uniref:PepSY domain-containing protein n=1 Tax=Streptomyces sp. NBC_00859 TaxID=2903682 RepID=UPI00386CAAC1|nr:PepSY domain-containing protein [Streptomyces sp. NBC_00859]
MTSELRPSKTADPCRPPVRRMRAGMRVVASLCAVAASAGLVSGCSGPHSDRDSAGTTAANASPSSSTGLTEDQAERKALIPSAKVSYAKAADTAVGRVPGSKLAEIELKKQHGSAGTSHPQWVAKVATKDGTAHSVTVDAVSGKVTRSVTESDQDSDDKSKLAGRLADAKQTPQQAARTATAKKKGTVSSIDLDDNDSGTLIWSVDVVTTNDWNKTTFDIGATDGKIKREHVDND